MIVFNDPTDAFLPTLWHDHTCPTCGSAWGHDDPDCGDVVGYECIHCINAYRAERMPRTAMVQGRGEGNR